MAAINDLFNSVKTVFLKDAKGRFRKRSEVDFIDIKNQIIGRVSNHPILDELESNAESNFITSTNGRSFSLFGALGFESNRSPRAEIKKALSDRIVITPSPDGTRFSITLPELTDLDNHRLLRLDQRDKSWVSYVEEGFDGLAFYYEKDGYGRSNLGWQNKNANNLGRSYSGVDFMTKIFEEFKEKYRGSVKIN